MSEIKWTADFDQPRKQWRAPRRQGGTLAIGVIEPNYGLERVSYALRSDAFQHSVARGLRFRGLDRRSNFYQQTPFVIARGFDLVHSWNSTPRNGAFVTSVEMEFPRLFGRISARQMAFAIGRVASFDCKGIWPLSDAALAYVRRRFEQMGRSDLVAKLTVFRGGIAERPEPPKFDRHDANKTPLKVLFVGDDGLRKGLYPLVRAVRRVVAAGGDVRLTVVGRFTSHSYVTPGRVFNRAAFEEASRDEPWMSMHNNLPNAVVRALMDEHDVLAFPTIDESLGWVPMEAAMSGVPTISTNVFAIPEFVHEKKTGWIISIDLNEDRRWRHIGDANNFESFLAMEDQIAMRLEQILGEILDQREIIASYGAAAYDLAMRQYSPAKAAVRLAQLYRQALSS